MGGLSRRGFALTAVASGVVFCLGLMAASVRLLPWWFSHDVPISVSIPFGLALVAAALEAALVVGAPIGVALALGIGVERGEVRALQALGASPWRVVRSMWPIPIVIGGLAMVLDVGWDARSAPPGIFAQRLVQEAKTSCYASDAPRALSVPLVNVTWLCFKGQPPRAVAPLPGSSDAWVVAQDVQLSPNLRSIALTQLQIESRPGPQRPTLHVQVDQGVIGGLPSWGRGTRLSGVERGLAALLVVLGSALGSGFALVRWNVSAPTAVVAVGLISPALALAAMSRLDASDLPLALLGFVPLGCALLPALLIWPVRRLLRSGARGANPLALC